MLILFDVIGTLFSLEAIKNELRGKGLDEHICGLWFAKLLQSAMACTLARRYTPFKALAEPSLKQVFAIAGIDAGCFKDVLGGLDRLEPYPDAVQCLRDLRVHGHRLAVLTNSGREDTERLLERWALKGEFERIFSADDARVCKPHPALYETARRVLFASARDCCIVTAHGWDILGAEAAGMSAVYINRLERHWAFPGRPEGFTVSSLRDVPFAVSNQEEMPARKAA